MKILIKIRFITLVLLGAIFGLANNIAAQEVYGPQTFQANLEANYFKEFITSSVQLAQAELAKKGQKITQTQMDRITRLVNSLAYGFENLSPEKLADLFIDPESKMRSYLQQIILDIVVNDILYTDYTAEHLFGSEGTWFGGFRSGKLCTIFQEYFAGIFTARPRILKSDSNRAQTEMDFVALVENVASLLLSTSKCWSNALVTYKNDLAFLKLLIGAAVRQYAYLENTQQVAIAAELQSRRTGKLGFLLKPFYAGRSYLKFSPISQDAIETAMRAYYQESVANGLGISYEAFVKQASTTLESYMKDNPKAGMILSGVQQKAERGLFKRTIYSGTKNLVKGAIVVTGASLVKNRETIKKAFTEQGMKAALYAAATGLSYDVVTMSARAFDYVKAAPGKTWEGIKAAPGTIWSTTKAVGRGIKAAPGKTWEGIKATPRALKATGGWLVSAPGKVKTQVGLLWASTANVRKRMSLEQLKKLWPFGKGAPATPTTQIEPTK